MHCLGSGGIRQTWQNLAETVDCGRIWQRRQIAANCGGTCGRLWWRQVESRWRVCKVSRRCPVTDTKPIRHLITKVVRHVWIIFDYGLPENDYKPFIATFQ